MERGIDVYADVLDDQGTWQRVILRVRTDAGHFAGVRPLDYLGKVEAVSGCLVGTGARAHCRDRKDAPAPQWLARLKARLKGVTNA